MAMKNKSFNEPLVLTRPGPKWLWGPDGTLVSTAAGTPAMAFDPITGDSDGIEISSRANFNIRHQLVGHSYDLTQWNTQVNVALSLETDPKFPFPVTRIITGGNSNESAVGGGLVRLFSSTGWTHRKIIFKPITMSGSITISARANRPSVSLLGIDPDLRLTTYNNANREYIKPVGDGWYEAGVAVALNSEYNTLRDFSIAWAGANNVTENIILVAHTQANESHISSSIVVNDTGLEAEDSPDDLRGGVPAGYDGGSFMYFCEYRLRMRQVNSTYARGGKILFRMVPDTGGSGFTQQFYFGLRSPDSMSFGVRDAGRTGFDNVTEYMAVPSADGEWQRSAIYYEPGSHCIMAHNGVVQRYDDPDYPPFPISELVRMSYDGSGFNGWRKVEKWNTDHAYTERQLAKMTLRPVADPAKIFDPVPAKEFEVEEEPTVGIFFDFTDTSTMFQDIDMTLPVTSDGDIVQVILDKSQRLRLGEELIVDGYFENGLDDWTAGDLWAAPSRRAYANGVTSATSAQRLVTDAYMDTNKIYKISFSLDILEGGIKVSGQYGSFTRYFDQNGQHTFLVRGGDVGIQFFRDENYGIFKGWIGSVSIREVLGNHSVQFDPIKAVTYHTDGVWSWIESDGIDDAFPASLVSSRSGLTMVADFKAVSDTPGTVLSLFRTGNTENTVSIVDGSLVVRSDDGTTVTVDADQTQRHIQTLLFDFPTGSAAYLRDRQLVQDITVSADTDAGLPGSLSFMADNSFGTNATAVKFFSFFLCDRVLSTAERKEVEFFCFKRRWIEV